MTNPAGSPTDHHHPGSAHEPASAHDHGAHDHGAHDHGAHDHGAHQHGAAPSGDGGPRIPKQEQEDATTAITEVAPGILRSQLPISMPGLGHVNCYIMEDERGIAVMDPGLPGPDSWDALVDRLGRAGYKVADVHTVVVTHSHPDHFGGALRLRYESGAEIVSHESFKTMFDDILVTDSEDSEDLSVRSFDEQMEIIERFMAQPTPWGGQRPGPRRDFFEQMRSENGGNPASFETVKPTVRLFDGQTIRLARREWIAMHTPGHTEDHLCLYDPEHGVVFTGDHVLPSITPHIGGTMPQEDPLSMFFSSLNRMMELTDISVALPAHGHPFTDLRGRSEHIIDHHEDRLDILRKASVELDNGSVNDYMKVLFRERSWGEMAESETYAHLEHLRILGEFGRHHEAGLARYRPLR